MHHNEKSLSTNRIACPLGVRTFLDLQVVLWAVEILGPKGPSYRTLCL